MKNFLKNAFWTAAALCLLLAVLLTASVRRQAAELASRVVRLHVVAASDEAFTALGDGAEASLAGDGVVLKFRFVEWLEKLTGRLAASKAR